MNTTNFLNVRAVRIPDSGFFEFSISGIRSFRKSKKNRKTMHRSVPLRLWPKYIFQVCSTIFKWTEKLLGTRCCQIWATMNLFKISRWDLGSFTLCSVLNWNYSKVLNLTMKLFKISQTVFRQEFVTTLKIRIEFFTKTFQMRYICNQLDQRWKISCY